MPVRYIILVQATSPTQKGMGIYWTCVYYTHMTTELLPSSFCPSTTIDRFRTSIALGPESLYIEIDRFRQLTTPSSVLDTYTSTSLYIIPGTITCIGTRHRKGRGKRRSERNVFTRLFIRYLLLLSVCTTTSTNPWKEVCISVYCCVMLSFVTISSSFIVPNHQIMQSINREVI